MRCQYCGLISGEDDHRCLHCGRRMPGIAVSAPASYIGATALALSPMAERTPETEPEQAPLFQSSLQPGTQATPQWNYPASQKVIPFEDIQRQAAVRFASQLSAPGIPADTVRKPAASPRTAAKKASPPVGQGNLDFRANAAQGERVLATGVPAQVYGDSRVAPPMRRLTAGAMDVAMVLLGFGVFAGSAAATGVLLGRAPGFGAGKTLWITLATAMLLISLFYGLVWAMAKRETAGMSWTDLHLVTFDGSSLDGRSRAVRFVSAWLSYCSGGLGLLWALADEENLAFHDHISKSFPAEKGTTGVLVRQRR